MKWMWGTSEPTRVQQGRPQVGRIMVQTARTHRRAELMEIASNHGILYLLVCTYFIKHAVRKEFYQITCNQVVNLRFKDTRSNRYICVVNAPFSSMRTFQLSRVCHNSQFIICVKYSLSYLMIQDITRYWLWVWGHLGA